MTSLTTYNAIALIIAGIIGLIIGWWLFKRAIADGKRPASTTRSSAPRAEAPAPAPAAEPAPAAQKGEGKGLADEDAAAIADIAGQFLGVDVQDSDTDARRVVEQTGITYRVATDQDGALFQALGAINMPTTVLVDGRGNIIEVFNGEVSGNQLDTVLRNKFPA